MEYILVLILLALELFSSVVKSQVVSVDHDKNIVTIEIEKIDVGMSGFIVHQFAKNHSSILKNVKVESYDKDTKIATLRMSKYDDLSQSAIPRGLWKVQVGDTAVLAFGYSRAVLIAPNADVYHRITRSTPSLQWVHPDIFASILSYNGHPTPLKKDFDRMSISTTIGLYFFYLDKKLFTIDARSFKILNISDALLEQNDIKLPFYSRVDKISEAWWGEGSDPLEDYEPHYYELLVTHNKEDKKLLEIIKNGDEKLQFLVKEFIIENEDIKDAL